MSWMGEKLDRFTIRKKVRFAEVGVKVLNRMVLFQSERNISVRKSH